MQQQDITTDMAKDVPKQNFSIEKAKTTLPSTNYVYHKIHKFSMVYIKYSINHRNDIKMFRTPVP